MRMQGMRPAGLLIVILATVMCSPMPVLAQATARSAQSDCQREAARNGYQVIRTGDFRQIPDGWQLELTLRSAPVGAERLPAGSGLQRLPGDTHRARGR